MAYACDICGKGIMRGLNVSHAKNRTKKVWLPNLRTTRLNYNGRTRVMRLCVKCLRRIKKEAYTKNPKFQPADTLQPKPVEQIIPEKIEVKKEKAVVEKKIKKAKTAEKPTTRAKKSTKKAVSAE